MTDGTHQTPTYVDKGVPFISAQNVKPFVFDEKVYAYVSEEDHIEYNKTVAPEKGDVLFTITDTGRGIPPEKHSRLFARFEKLDEYTQGAGLGLAISKQIVTRLGGKIWIDPDYTNGARFCFTHPL